MQAKSPSTILSLEIFQSESCNLNRSRRIRNSEKMCRLGCVVTLVIGTQQRRRSAPLALQQVSGLAREMPPPKTSLKRKTARTRGKAGSRVSRNWEFSQFQGFSRSDWEENFQGIPYTNCREFQVSRSKVGFFCFCAICTILRRAVGSGRPLWPAKSQSF